MKLAFIGFGEAAQAMSRGFHCTSMPVTLSAYDVRVGQAPHGEALSAAAAASGVRLASTPEDAVREADVVLSLVQGSVSRAAAQTVAPFLADTQVFVDLNSTSPAAKRAVGEAIASGKGIYVEGAVMDAVTPKEHRVPILLAGPTAADTAGALNGIGMDCEAIGGEIGQASAVKMIRSVMMKGVEALILEALGAAETAGVTERILDSVNRSFAGLDWRSMASHYLRRTHEHGARRVAEMHQSAETLRELGLEPSMSEAIAAAIEAGHTRLNRIPYDPKAAYSALLAELVRP